MMNWKVICLAITCICASGCSRKASPENVADLVVRHANIHTMDEKLPRATALAIKGDKIIMGGRGRRSVRLYW